MVPDLDQYRVVLDLEKCLIFPVPNRKVLNKVKCSIGISAESCAALNHVATVKKTREELKGSQGAKRSRECYQSTSEEIMTMENFYNS